MSLRVQLLRKLKRRPYGIVYFKIKKTLYPKIMDFSKDTINLGSNGFFILNRDKITIETDTVKREFDIAEYQSWREGFPVLFFDVNDCIPLRFENEPLDANHARQHPKAIQAILKKEIQAAEAEIMRKQRSTLFKVGVVTLGMAGLSWVFTMLVWSDVGKIITHFAIK